MALPTRWGSNEESKAWDLTPYAVLDRKISVSKIHSILVPDRIFSVDFLADNIFISHYKPIFRVVGQGDTTLISLRRSVLEPGGVGMLTTSLFDDQMHGVECSTECTCA